MSYLDINCDMGESFGAYTLGSDKEILDYVTSANIACGFHAGDPSTMRRTVQLALEKDVAIGAHPGFQDLIGFGRRNLTLSTEEIYDIITYQIGALQAFVTAEGGKLQHVKPHGALYNMAASNTQYANAIATAIYKINPELILFGLYNSELTKAAQRIGLRSANEVFSDRTYQNDGSLTLRTDENAVLKNHADAVQQVISMVKEGKVKSIQGTELPIKAHTVCIHGDGEHALQFAQFIHRALQEADVQLVKVRQFL